jgi:predicted dehydrogenase
MTKQTRRSFLKHTAGAAGLGAAFTIAGTKASGKVLGANEKIRVGVAGIRGRGSSHIKSFAGMDGVEVSYLIDPDRRTHDSKVAMVKEKAGNTPKCVVDVRDALDDKDLDVVSVATPNHWHSLITVWACQAGKDVYVEKPCSHNVFEGRQAVEAARKYKRIVQHGTQSRSSSGIARQVAAARSGKYGKLLVAKGYCCKPRWSIGFKPVEEPPKELDFNIWLGPGPDQPYHGNLVHYNWHWFWDFGNGDMGNQGVHQMDIARWAIDGGTLPKSVISMGGRWVNTPDNKDQGQTPNMELSVFDYGDTLLVFETRGLVAKHDDWPFKVANEFYCEEGAIIGGKFYPNGKDKGESLVDVDYEVQSGGPFGNFIDCVRSRKQENLNADILEGHYSSALCHLGNISYRVGKQAAFSKVRDAFGDNEHVQASLDAIKGNVKVVDVDLDEETCQLGPKLAFDAEAERFVDSDEANALLSRDYREPFVVPKKV